MKTQTWNVKLHFNVFDLSWKKKNFNENVYDELYPSSSALARIYGTPKMRKFFLLHSIVSSIGAFNNDLARFLCDLFSPVVPSGYSCKDTFFFCFSN